MVEAVGANGNFHPFNARQCDEALGESIGQVRERKNISKDSFAKHLGLSLNELAELEEGKTDIRAATVWAAAIALGLGPAQLFSRANALINRRVGVTLSFDLGTANTTTQTFQEIHDAEEILFQPQHREVLERMVRMFVGNALAHSRGE